MKFLDGVSCANTECHFNHDNYCYRTEIVLDIGGICESQETCDMYDCNECEFFDFCNKEKKYNSSAFTDDDEMFPSEEM